jgi:hypothetical protein
MKQKNPTPENAVSRQIRRKATENQQTGVTLDNCPSDMFYTDLLSYTPTL